VYYVGLLAGENDMGLLARSGVGRDINRHHYARAEIEARLQKPVVQSLLRLIRLRNSHPAFAGQFSHASPSGSELDLGWVAGPASVRLQVDFRQRTAEITTQGPGGDSTWCLAGAGAAMAA
jgi:sucrose phosphorylase